MSVFNIVLRPFCFMCGEEIPYKYSFGRGRNVNICKNRACREMYLNFHKAKSSEDETVGKGVAGFCSRCGKEMWVNFRTSNFRHVSSSSCVVAPVKRPAIGVRVKKIVVTKFKRVTPPKRRVHLKPWEDPNSLFCSPKLGEIVGKKIATGEECEQQDKRG